MSKILLTGGTGYIGSHTAIILQEKNYKIVLADNLKNSSVDTVNKIKKITGKNVDFEHTELTEYQQVKNLLEKNNFDVIVHFAALKNVFESIQNPFRYHYNNITSLLNLVRASKEYNVKKFIFSSSCSVYGNPSYLPVDEKHPFNKAASPYAKTKQISEYILEDSADDDFKVISLRYFNPIGTHESGLLGEQLLKNYNLIYYILQVALKKQKYLNIYGNDYDTPDGTGIRDYIHITDVALAHWAALKRLEENQTEKNYEAFNIGLGKGFSVLEIKNAFEKYTGITIPYRFAPRRKGDIAKIYASAELAKEKLKWEAKRNLQQMIESSWNWTKLY